MKKDMEKNKHYNNNNTFFPSFYLLSRLSYSVAGVKGESRNQPCSGLLVLLHGCLLASPPTAYVNISAHY